MLSFCPCALELAASQQHGSALPDACKLHAALHVHVVRHGAALLQEDMQSSYFDDTALRSPMLLLCYHQHDHDQDSENKDGNDRTTMSPQATNGTGPTVKGTGPLQITPLGLHKLAEPSDMSLTRKACRKWVSNQLDA